MTDEHLGPPPVEPLSDVAWARVERGLMARLDSAPAAVPARAPRRSSWVRLAVPAAALAVAAAIALVVFARHGEPSPADPIASASDEPSRVVAGEAPSSITFADAHVALEAHSAVVLAREVGSPSVLLERGAAVFSVAPRGNRPPFVVRAGDTVIRVVGTGFRVGRSEDHVTVAVDHGIVDVIHRGATHRLTAHQAWSSDHPDEVTELAAATTPTTTPATTVAQATPAPATTAAPEPTPAPAPAVVAPPRPRPTPPAIVTPAPPAPPSGPSISAADAARTEFDRLVQLEARDPAAALAGYLTLSAGNTVWSEVALFAAGRLAADRHDRRAKTLLTIYLRRFPRGANVRDARNLLDRLKGAPE